MSSFTVGDTVTIRATVRNIGKGDAGSSNLEYRIYGPGNREIGADRVSGLDAGESSTQELDYTFTDNDVGSLSVFRVTADSDTEVAESDESNNETVWGLFDVVSKPDLVISDLTVGGSSSPSNFTVGDRVRINATVQNIGAGSAGSSEIKYYLSNQEIGRDNVGSLNPRGTSGESIYYRFTESDVGTHYIKVVADSDTEIDEDNESNNETSTGNFTVGKPDLVISDLTVNGSSSPSSFTVRR